MWLSANHDLESEVWLVFFKKETGRPSIAYEAAVELALCFGWIDSIIKKIDDARYARKFTPRKDSSKWSDLNKRRVEKLLASNQMTEFGLAKIDAAKKSGEWLKTDRAEISFDIPPEFREALDESRSAGENFAQLTPSCKRQYIGWIATAKRPETKARRISEAISLLAEGKKLGLK